MIYVGAWVDMLWQTAALAVGLLAMRLSSSIKPALSNKGSRVHRFVSAPADHGGLITAS